jgi:hypothetical protein
MRMRSEIVNTFGKSLDMTRIARPSRASSRMRIDFRLCADIDTAGRLIDDENSSLASSPTSWPFAVSSVLSCWNRTMNGPFSVLDT